MTAMVSSEAALKPRRPDAQVSALRELVAPQAGRSAVSDSGTLSRCSPSAECRAWSPAALQNHTQTVKPGSTTTHFYLNSGKNLGFGINYSRA